MAHETFAPWAEVVPDAPYPMSVEELLALPDNGGGMYELVEGRLVRMPPPSGVGASGMSVKLSTALQNFVDARGLGHVSTADGEYVLSAPGEPTTALAPDAAFVRAENMPPFGTPAWDAAWHVAPDLAVEIASPNQYRPEMAAKAQVYLAAGTRLVWVVWPKRKEVDIWRRGDSQPAATLHVGDMLSGEDVLPGFAYAVANLFAAPPAPKQP